jgi:aerobic-type carbon monoxide dehydrogenase small subunit (CoxS/CutS family)
MTEKKKKSGEISRREFLRDAGLLVGGTAIGSSILLAACGGETTTETVTNTVTSTAPGGTQTVTSTVPGGTTTVTSTVSGPTSTQTVTVTKEVMVEGAAENVVKLTINGKLYELQVEPGWDLQYVLHDVLGFIDIKTFCYRGQCGSCTVIMDGRPILSCMMLAIECNGKNIETASGIADAKHPLIDAYIKNHCMQCGYCTPGFLTTVKALLDRNENPTAEDVVEAIAGNMCRCGTYPAHIAATLEAAETLRGGA